MRSRPDWDEAYRAFVPPAGFDRSIPREVRLTSAGRVVVALAAGLFAAGILTLPLLSLAAARHPQGPPVWLAYVVSASLIASSVLCRVLVSRQRRLVSEGRAAPAIVTSHVKHHSSHGGTHRYVTYDYRLLSGAVMRGKLMVGKFPAIGTVICILYDPDRPSRTSRYPLSLVRPAKP